MTQTSLPNSAGAVVGLMLAAASLGPVAGCARETTVRTEETAVRRTDGTVSSTADPVVSEDRHATTTTTVRAREDRGFLGTVAHLIGELIALPFRIVGGLIDLIF